MNVDDCAARALSALPEDVRTAFAGNPHQALTDLGLSIRAVDDLGQRRDGGGACDGVSFLVDGVVLYAPTPYSRRENFTLAHELGHWLVETDDTILDWLADQNDPEVLLESVCDRVGSGLLLPAATVTGAVGTGPVRAAHVLELYQASNASIPACAIALASALPTLGAAIIIDTDTNTVRYASVNPDPDHGWPTVYPWPGHHVPAGHPLKTLRAEGRMTGRSFWRNPWDARQDYYIDAVRRRNRIIAVLSSTDLWNSERLHLDAPREYDQRPTGQVHCCGVTSTVTGWPCSTCDTLYCPRCRRCACDRQASREVACSGTCNTKYLPTALTDGYCDYCHP